MCRGCQTCQHVNELHGTACAGVVKHALYLFLGKRIPEEGDLKGKI